MSVQPFLIGDGWLEVPDGDESCRDIFGRHYSQYEYADGRKPKLIIGPGGKLLLLRAGARAIFAWRQFVNDGGETGINCAIFRNEGDEVASKLIREAEALARQRWGRERFYTYVDPTKVKPTMVRGHPVWGFCFYRAGWSFSGLTKKGKHILDKVTA